MIELQNRKNRVKRRTTSGRNAM